MNDFFRGLIDQDIITESLSELEQCDRHFVRSLKSNIRRNKNLRDAINSKQISIKKLLSLPVEELAEDSIKSMRQKIIMENKKKVQHVLHRYTKDELDILVNKIEDP